MSYDEFIEFEKRTNKEIDKLQKEIEAIRKNQHSFVENIFKNHDYVIQIIKTYFSINELEFKPSSNKFGFVLETKKAEYAILASDYWAGHNAQIGSHHFEKFFQATFGLKIGKTYYDSSYNECGYGISLIPEDSSNFEKFYSIFDFKEQYEKLDTERKVQIDNTQAEIKKLQEKLKELKK